jgi:predicted phosphodiesterase
MKKIILGAIFLILCFNPGSSGISESQPGIMRKAPYLVYRGNNTEMTVLWQLDSTAPCIIKWGFDKSYGLGSKQTSEYENTHQHTYTITNLTPSTKYYYCVYANQNPYAGSFWTAPGADAKNMSFFSYGDTRTYTSTHDQVAEAIVSTYTGDEDYQSFIVHTGDIVANGDLESSWDSQLFDPSYQNIQTLLANLPFQACMGNHEKSGVLFKKYFPYPFVNDRYWSYDYGPAHFVVIDQYTPYDLYSDQLDWIENDLASSMKPWKFIFLHEPGWSAGAHENNTTVQNYIQPLCEQYGVNIVFAGHNHYYARAEVNGVQHITTGGGGAPLYTPNPGYPNIVSTSRSHHFCKVEINHNVLIFKAVKPGGTVIDEFTTRFSLPQIELNRAQLNFGAYASYTSNSQTFLISNSGGNTLNLNWSVSTDQSWLSCSPSSGTNSSFVTVSVDPSGLPVGTYTGTITVSDPNASNSPQTIIVTLKVYGPGTTGAPFGIFATPVNGSIVSSSIAVTGWVLDDIGVESVKIYREEGSLPVYIGDAIFVEGARPDVEQAYPGYPMNYRAGWGYMMLTNFLPYGNGIFTIIAAAEDTEGNKVTLGVKTITIDNANAIKPFGAIDTPSQGGAASGSSFINWGWVLTPIPNCIPTDGSTIGVYVDGVYLGHPTYHIYRSDIAGLFPGYCNANGAVGYFYLDTTSYENGVHTIHWAATDDAGNSDGIGSRYFSVQNSGTAAASKKAAVFNVQRSMFNVNPGQIPINDSFPVWIKKGYNPNDAPLVVYPGEEGIITIEIKELERLEIRFNNDFTTDESGTGSSTLNIEPRTLNISPLPIGSTLDTKKGVFYWLPGPGFVGSYRLLFIVKGQNEEKELKDIIVKIGPGYVN